VSHSPSLRRAVRSSIRDGRADGFTLVEVIVSLGVFLVVMAALLPQLVVALKSTTTARLVSQAKGVAQGQLDAMRNMPFHVGPDAGDHIDVLDTYYRDLALPDSAPSCESGGTFNEPQTTWSGYVPDGAARCSYEPAGPMYRKVINPVTAPGFGTFAVVVDTQFLSPTTPPSPVTPPSGYDSQDSGKDTPASSQVGVTVTVVYEARGTRRPVTTYTQISRRNPTAARIRAEASVTAVEMGSSTPTDGPLSLSAGLVNISGALFHTSRVTANLAATTAGVSSGTQGSGASATAVAPPTVTAPLTTAAEGALGTWGCDYACWGATQVGPFSVTAQDGLPRAGTPGTPLQVLIPEGASRGGFTFGNGSTDPGLELSPPLVTMDTTVPAPTSGVEDCSPSGSGSPSLVTATGYVHTTPDTDGTNPLAVDACAVAQTSPVSLFPTTFAPTGVVRILLSHATARCTVSGDTHAPTTDYGYSAEVQYWNGSGYETAGVITPETTSDPLESVPLTTSVGNGHILGDYIASWSALTADKVRVTTSPGTAAVTVPGVVTVASQPVRGVDDPASMVSVTVGALSCRAEDSR
jgi:prepilin-type N-terminal cleavage/methylation domain-containing protein